MERFVNQLILGGLTRVPSEYVGVKVAVGVYNGTGYGVVAVDADVARDLGMVHYGLIDEWLRQMFIANCYENSSILHIVWTSDGGALPVNRRPEESYWLVDKTSNRIIIYEDQPGSFLDIRQKLEEYLESGIITRPKEKPKKLRLRTSIITYLLVAINVIVFIYTASHGDVTSAAYIYKCGGAYAPAIIDDHEVYRLFYSMFLHFGLDHIVNNMFVLLMTGILYESCKGSLDMLIVYMGGGLISSVCSTFYHYSMEGNIVSAGASGAVFAVIGALVAIIIFDKNDRKYFNSTRIMLLATSSLFSGFNQMGIDNMAHVSGFISGLVLSFILIMIKNRKESIL